MKNTMKRVMAFILSAIMLLSMMPLAFAANTANFVDMPTGWSKEAVTAAVKNGLLNGYEGNVIKPRAQLTRAELATIITRAFGATEMADISAFKDVPMGNWYYDAIARAVQMGVMNGQSATEMAPDRPITRQEVFTVLARALVFTSGDHSSLNRFADSSKIAPYAKDGLAMLAKKGYINGDEKGNLNPGANITREEFAQFMHNMIKTYITAPGTYSTNLTGIAVVRTSGVTLQNLSVSSDLVIGDGAGTNSVKIQNVSVNGRLLARGGTITLKNTTLTENVVVNNPNTITRFINYRTEPVFKNMLELTKATFLGGTQPGLIGGGGSGSGSGSTSKTYTITFVVDGVTYTKVVTDRDKPIGAENMPTPPTKPGYTFVKWIIKETGETFDENTVITGKMTIEAVFEINEYTVTFMSEGSVYATKTVKYMETVGQVNMPANPEKAGHAFSKWVYDGDKEFTADTKVTDNMTVTATFTTNFYTVTFMSEGSLHATKTVAYGTALGIANMPAKPTKAGHAFDAWIYDSNQEFTPDTIVTGDMTVTATFTTNSYTVTFTVDGVQYATKTVAYGTAIGVADMPAAPTKTGYTFEGWLHDGNSFDAATIVTEDITVTADFTINEYTVTFTVDGATYATRTADYNTALGANEMPAAPTKTGHTFSKWVVDGTGETFDENTVITDAMTVKAEFTVNEYTITFKVNGTTYATRTVLYNTTLDAADMPAEPTQTGHTFSKWVVDGTGETFDENTVITEGITVNAEFTTNDYTVTFIVDGTQYATKTVTYNESIGAANMPANPEKTGHAFIGWVDANGNPFAADTLVTDNMIVTAEFTTNFYTVTFLVDGGAYATKNVAYNQSIGAANMPADPEKTGHAFIGWVDANGNPFTADTIVTGTMTVVAKFSTDTYTVTFLVDGAPYATKEVAHGTAIGVANMPADPVKSGWTFVKWLDENDAAFTATTVVTADMTVTAVFTQDPVYVKVNFYYGYSTDEYDLIDEQTILSGATAVSPAISTGDYKNGYKENADVASVYAGNEYQFKAKPSYWYVNETGNLTPFDDTIIIKEDTDVFLLAKGMSVFVQLKTTPFAFKSYYDKETRVVDSVKNFAFSGRQQLATAFALGQLPDMDKIVDKLYGKLKSDKVVDEDLNIRVLSVDTPISRLVKRSVFENKVGPYLEKTEFSVGVSDLVDRTTLQNKVDPYLDKTDITVTVPDMVNRTSLKNKVDPYLNKTEYSVSISDMADRQALQDKVAPYLAQTEYSVGISGITDRQTLQDKVDPYFAQTEYSTSISDLVSESALENQINPYLAKTLFEVHMHDMLDKAVLDEKAEPYLSQTEFSAHISEMFEKSVLDAKAAPYITTPAQEAIFRELEREMFEEDEFIVSTEDLLYVELFVEIIEGYTAQEILDVVKNETLQNLMDLLDSNEIIEEVERIRKEYINGLKAVIQEVYNTGVSQTYPSHIDISFNYYSVMYEELERELLDEEEFTITEENLPFVKLFSDLIKTYDAAKVLDSVSDATLDNLIELLGEETILEEIEAVRAVYVNGLDAAISQVELTGASRMYATHIDLSLESYKTTYEDLKKELFEEDAFTISEDTLPFVKEFVEVLEGYDAQDLLDTVSNASLDKAIELLGEEAVLEEIEAVRDAYVKDLKTAIAVVEAGGAAETYPTAINVSLQSYQDTYEALEQEIFEEDTFTISEDTLPFVKLFLDIVDDYTAQNIFDSVSNASLDKFIELFGEDIVLDEIEDVRYAYVKDLETAVAEVEAGGAAKAHSTSISVSLESYKDTYKALEKELFEEDTFTISKDTLPFVKLFLDVVDDYTAQDILDSVSSTSLDKFIELFGKDVVLDEIDNVTNAYITELETAVAEVEAGGAAKTHPSSASVSLQSYKDAYDALEKELFEEEFFTVSKDTLPFVKLFIDMVDDYSAEDILDEIKNDTIEELIELLGEDVILAEIEDVKTSYVAELESVVTAVETDGVERKQATSVTISLEAYKTIYESLEKELFEEELFTISEDTLPFVKVFVDMIKDYDAEEVLDSISNQTIKDLVDLLGKDMILAEIETIKGNYVAELEAAIAEVEAGGEAQKQSTTITVSVQSYIDTYRQFEKELFEEESFTITADNLSFVKLFADTMKDFDGEEVLDTISNATIQKVLNLIGKQVIIDKIDEVKGDYVAGLDAAIQEVETTGTETKYTTSITIKLDPIAELYKPLYSKAQPKVEEKLASRENVFYSQNEYLQYLVENDYLADVLDGDGSAKTDSLTGYKLKDIMGYYDFFYKMLLVGDDAICWYGDTDNVSEERFDAVYTAMFGKMQDVNDKVDEALADFVADGTLPSSVEKALTSIKRINSLFTQYESKLKTLADKYLNSSVNDKLEDPDLKDNDKINTSLDVLFGKEDPTITVDTIYELFYRFDDKVHAKLKDFVASDKFDRAMAKVESTALGNYVSALKDEAELNSKKAEIVATGKVTTSFKSIYNLFMIVAEYGIDPFVTDENNITVVDAYEVTIGKITVKVKRFYE